MKFSVKKTIHLKIGKIKNNFAYELNGENISTSETVRDLGITVDNKLYKLYIIAYNYNN
jgi:hypothetical protein